MYFRANSRHAHCEQQGATKATQTIDSAGKATNYDQSRFFRRLSNLGPRHVLPTDFRCISTSTYRRQKRNVRSSSDIKKTRPPAEDPDLLPQWPPFTFGAEMKSEPKFSARLY
jgi:hypothetical protein